jgi:hypothetical protein
LETAPLWWHPWHHEYQASWSTRWSHRACQKVCWRKISTSRQAHSKPNEAGLTQVRNPKRASQFFWNWQRMKSS